MAGIVSAARRDTPARLNRFGRHIAIAKAAAAPPPRGSPRSSAVKDGEWVWTGDHPATYQSSPGVWRDFCATCGSQMAYRSTKFPGEIHFYAATLDHPETYTPTGHVHTNEQLPWVQLADGLPHR